MTNFKLLAAKEMLKFFNDKEKKLADAEKLYLSYRRKTRKRNAALASVRSRSFIPMHLNFPMYDMSSFLTDTAMPKIIDNKVSLAEILKDYISHEA